MLCIEALPFVNIAHAQEIAQESAQEVTQEEQNKWLDDYSRPVRFTYGAQATLNAAYIWRGIYAGGPNIQVSANVGFAGLYAEVWSNIGADSWAFKRFQPELDVSLGFRRWGINAGILLVHNFNCGFFDFGNYSTGDGIGNRLEISGRFTVSSKLPLSFYWATRVSAADSYINDAGVPVRAWSSYAEVSYTQKLPYGLSLYGGVGFTPWRSCYTRYERGFAVTNIDVRLRKNWELNKYFGLLLFGQVTINPDAIAADKSSIHWQTEKPSEQSINFNVGCGVYLR